MIIFTLLVLGGAAVYFMSAEQRTILLHSAVAFLRRLPAEAARLHAWYRMPVEADSPPKPWPVVTIFLAGTTIATFARMALLPGDLSDTDTLVAWGANFGPRTTNAEWWRLVTASFLHTSTLVLLMNVAALVQVSVLLERVVGRAALLAVYLSAAVFAGLVTLSAQPLAVTVGASGAVFGIYGLFLTSWMWSAIRQSQAIRLPVVARLAPVAIIFGVYHVSSGELEGTAQAASVVAGFLGGLVLASGVHVCKPSVVRVTVAVSTAALLAVASAAPLRGLTDIRPLITQLVSVEKATAAAYDAEVARFRGGRASTHALCSLIERQILPELQAAAAPLKDLQGVPEAHRPVRAAASRFFSLRVESWQLRLRGLRKGSMAVLRDADAVESKSLELFRTMAADQPLAP
jgi:rhomboid protease GluP